MNNALTTLIPGLLFTSMLCAQERIEMEGTSVRGNRELPRVLYIVPWKSPDPVELGNPAFTSILDQSLKPIERSSFKRQVDYFDVLYPYNEASAQP